MTGRSQRTQFIAAGIVLLSHVTIVEAAASGAPAFMGGVGGSGVRASQDVTRPDSSRRP